VGITITIPTTITIIIEHQVIEKAIVCPIGNIFMGQRRKSPIRKLSLDQKSLFPIIHSIL